MLRQPRNFEPYVRVCEATSRWFLPRYPKAYFHGVLEVERTLQPLGAMLQPLASKWKHISAKYIPGARLPTRNNCPGLRLSGLAQCVRIPGEFDNDAPLLVLIQPNKYNPRLPRRTSTSPLRQQTLHNSQPSSGPRPPTQLALRLCSEMRGMLARNGI